MQHDQILIVDFGSQVTQLIARRVREMGVYSEVIPFQNAGEAFRRMKPRAVILSGGPDSVTRAWQPPRTAGDVSMLAYRFSPSATVSRLRLFNWAGLSKAGMRPSSAVPMSK